MYISASTDLKFRSWPDNEPDLVYSPSSQNNIIHVSWCNDNNYVAILPQNYQPEIISTRNKSCVKLVHTVQAVEDVTAVAFQKTTKKILGIGTGNGDVALYDTKHRYVSRTYNNPGGAVEFLDFDPNDHCLAVACTDGTITLNSLITETNGEILKLPGFAQPTALCYHPTNNASLATGSNKGEIILWDTISGCKTFFTQSHCAAVNGLIITSSGSVLISVGQDHKLCIYDLNISECLFRNSLPQPLTAISGHSNGSFIAVGAEDGMEYLYDMRMLLDPVHTYREHTTRVNRITFENNFEDYGDFSEDTSIKTGYTMNCSQASEVSKCQSVDSSKEHGSKLKEEVMQTLHSHMHDLTKKMKEHFCLFSNFVDSEFNILQNSLEEKYDFLKMPHMEGDIGQY